MGANRWGHVGELEALGRSSLRLYLDATPAANRYRLERHLSSGEQFVAQSVVLAAGGEPSTQAAPVLARSLDAHDALVYVSEALPPGTELSGRFSGALDLTASRSDFAVRIALYELLASGDYFALFDPPYEFRASEAREHGGPRPLRIGRRQSLTFTSDRLTSRRLQAGSRLVVVLGVDPQRTAALTLAPARGRRADAPPETLQLKWYGSSYIDLPVGK